MLFSYSLSCDSWLSGCSHIVHRSPNMNRLLMLTLGAAVTVAACGTAASDGGGDTPLESRPAAEAPRRAPRDVTIPSGTQLELTLTSSVGSDTSTIEDRVTAELTRAVTIDGREVLPAGSQLAGMVTNADDSGRVKGRANITFMFSSLRAGDARYDVRTVPVSRTAAATKGEDATKIGIGAGAGAVIGGLLGGKDGAAKGAAVGGGAGTGVVLATKGKEVRLSSGDDVTTQLTAPLTVRLRR
jgi:hypothetical protein